MFPSQESIRTAAYGLDFNTHVLQFKKGFNLDTMCCWKVMLVVCSMCMCAHTLGEPATDALIWPLFWKEFHLYCRGPAKTQRPRQPVNPRRSSPAPFDLFSPIPQITFCPQSPNSSNGRQPGCNLSTAFTALKIEVLVLNKNLKIGDLNILDDAFITVYKERASMCHDEWWW